MNSYPAVRWQYISSICHMMNIKILEKSNGEFYHLKCYVIRDAYHMIPATHGLIRVQGVEEDTPSNMFLLSTLKRWSFTEHTSWPSKPRLPKFPQRDL